MDKYEMLTAQINEKVDKIVEDAEAFRLDILRKIADAKNNEILECLKALDTRLTGFGTRIAAMEARLPEPRIAAMEARLPEPEDDNG